MPKIIQILPFNKRLYNKKLLANSIECERDGNIFFEELNSSAKIGKGWLEKYLELRSQSISG